MKTYSAKASGHAAKTRALRQVALLGAVWWGASGFAAQAPEAVPSNRLPEWAAPVSTNNNLYRVTPTLFRSAKLRKADVALLQSLGVKTVVSLRAFHSDREALKGSNIQMKRIGINTWDIDDHHVIAALRTLQAAEQEGPVLLHCLHGADRTGLITAMYRILHQGWSKEQALEELTQGGYGYHALWKNIPTYLKQVDVEKIRAAVNAP